MKPEGVPGGTSLPSKIASKFVTYSDCFRRLNYGSPTAREGWRLYNKMEAIVEWAKTADAKTPRVHEQLAAIAYANTCAPGCDCFLAPPTSVPAGA
jgi:hypothetical protein